MAFSLIHRSGRIVQAVALSLMLPVIAWAETAQRTDAVRAHIERTDPISCGRPFDGVTASDACAAEVGTYQLARLSLAVETFASVLAATSVKGSHQDLQGAIYGDIVNFGIKRALVEPAMAITDMASLNRSPFGQAGSSVAARSLIALDYLYPRTTEKLGISSDALSRASGLPKQGGFSDFSQFLEDDRGQTVNIDKFRQFGPPSTTGPLLEKVSFESKPLSGGITRNFTGDMNFTKEVDVRNIREFPVANVVAALAHTAIKSGTTVLPHTMLSAGNDEDGAGIKRLPFGGHACSACEKPGAGKQTMNDVPSIIPEKFGIGDLTGTRAFASQSPVTSKIAGGTEFLAAIAGGRHERSNSQGQGLTENQKPAMNTRAADSGSMVDKGDPPSATKKTFKKTVKAVVKRAAALYAASKVGDKMGKVLKFAGGSAKGLGVGLLFTTENIACAEGEVCAKGYEVVKTTPKETIDGAKDGEKKKEKKGAGKPDKGVTFKDKKKDKDSAKKKEKKADDGKPADGQAGASGGTGKGGKDGSEKNGDAKNDAAAKSVAGAHPNSYTPNPADGVGNDSQDNGGGFKTDRSDGPAVPADGCANPRDPGCGCEVNTNGVMGKCIQFKNRFDISSKVAPSPGDGWVFINGPDRLSTTVFRVRPLSTGATVQNRQQPQANEGKSGAHGRAEIQIVLRDGGAVPGWLPKTVPTSTGVSTVKPGMPEGKTRFTLPSTPSPTGTMPAPSSGHSPPIPHEILPK